MKITLFFALFCAVIGFGCVGCSEGIPTNKKELDAKLSNMSDRLTDKVIDIAAEEAKKEAKKEIKKEFGF